MPLTALTPMFPWTVWACRCSLLIGRHKSALARRTGRGPKGDCRHVSQYPPPSDLPLTRSLSQDQLSAWGHRSAKGREGLFAAGALGMGSGRRSLQLGAEVSEIPARLSGLLPRRSFRGLLTRPCLDSPLPCKGQDKSWHLAPSSPKEGAQRQEGLSGRGHNTLPTWECHGYPLVGPPERALRLLQAAGRATLQLGPQNPEDSMVTRNRERCRGTSLASTSEKVMMKMSRF